MKNKIKLSAKIRVGILMSLPALLSFFLFKYYPIYRAIFISLYDYKIIDPPGTFIGLKNYIDLFNISLVLKSWENTFVIFILGFLLGFWVPLVQAILLNEIKKGNTLFRVLFFLPAAAPPMVVLVVWKYIYNPDFGLLNNILEKIGLSGLGWLNDPSLSKLSIALPGILGGGGLGLVYGGALSIFIYLAAIKSIPNELYEAANIDGAGFWQKIRYIMVPNITYIIVIQFILALITGFKLFDAPFVLTGGGPVNSTRTVALNIYYYAFQLNKMGFASAIAVTLFLLLVIMTVIRFIISRDEF